MFLYHVRTALINLFRNTAINVLTIFSLAVGLSLISLTLLSVFTLKTAVKDWTSDFGMVVYLENDVQESERLTLERTLTEDPEIRSVRYVSSEDAMAELNRVLGADLLEGIEENPLPASFKISLSRQSLDAARVRTLAERLAAMNGISDVEYGQKWVERMATAARRFSLFGSMLGLSLGIGIVFILSNTIKILFYRRAQEIDILKLLGATRGFIRAPFLVEGVLLGTVSGLLSGGGNWVIRDWAVKGYGVAVETPWPLAMTEPLIILVGALLGLVASFIALGRIRL